MAEAETYFQSPEATTVTKPVNDEFSHGKAYFDDDIKSQPKGRGDMTPTPAFSNDERAMLHNDGMWPIHNNRPLSRVMYRDESNKFSNAKYSNYGKRRLSDSHTFKMHCPFSRRNIDSYVQFLDRNVMTRRGVV